MPTVEGVSGEKQLAYEHIQRYSQRCIMEKTWPSFSGFLIFQNCSYKTEVFDAGSCAMKHRTLLIKKAYLHIRILGQHFWTLHDLLYMVCWKKVKVIPSIVEGSWFAPLLSHSINKGPFIIHVHYIILYAGEIVYFKATINRMKYHGFILKDKMALWFPCWEEQWWESRDHD